jgi:hypothetical protein
LLLRTPEGWQGRLAVAPADPEGWKALAGWASAGEGGEGGRARRLEAGRGPRACLRTEAVVTDGRAAAAGGSHGTGTLSGTKQQMDSSGRSRRRRQAESQPPVILRRHPRRAARQRRRMRRAQAARAAVGVDGARGRSAGCSRQQGRREGRPSGRVRAADAGAAASASGTSGDRRAEAYGDLPLLSLMCYAYPAYECYKTVELNKPEIEHLIFLCQYWSDVIFNA